MNFHSSVSGASAQQLVSEDELRRLECLAIENHEANRHRYKYDHLKIMQSIRRDLERNRTVPNDTNSISLQDYSAQQLQNQQPILSQYNLQQPRPLTSPFLSSNLAPETSCLPSANPSVASFTSGTESSTSRGTLDKSSHRSGSSHCDVSSLCHVSSASTISSVTAVSATAFSGTIFTRPRSNSVSSSEKSTRSSVFSVSIFQQSPRMSRMSRGSTSKLVGAERRSRRPSLMPVQADEEAGTKSFSTASNGGVYVSFQTLEPTSVVQSGVGAFGGPKKAVPLTKQDSCSSDGWMCQQEQRHKHEGGVEADLELLPFGLPPLEVHDTSETCSQIHGMQ